jgi:type III secretory pathway component EscV
MLSLSYLLIPKEYSLFEKLFAYDKSKEIINKENKDINANLIKHKLSEKIGKSNINLSNIKKSEKKLILKLEESIDNFLYRKKVRALIKKIKSSYIIQSSTFFPDLFLEVISAKKNKKYQVVYEPILKEHVAFLPKKSYRNKKKLKFVIKNIKDEILIEPLYQIEYKNGSIFNILDLQQIDDKENEKEKDFKMFLNQNFKTIIKENKEPKAITKSKSDYEVINKEKIKDTISLPKITSILKKKPKNRIKKDRKISFGNEEFSY